MMIDRLAIVGLGLMGGSLGLAAKARKLAGEVVVSARRSESRREALARDAADAVFEAPADAVAGADMVVLCTPVLTIPAMVRDIRDRLQPGCVVTDVGSTKAVLDHEIQALLADSPVTFVGSHPMTGSEKNGFRAARADLYEDACVIVTPAGETNAIQTACRKVSSLWTRLGARVSVLTPDEHDAVIARTSHLPHLVAAALVAAVDRDAQDVSPFCGPGFRCTTRVAEGSEAIWHDIIKTNRDALRSELRAFEQEIDRWRQLLDAKDWEAVRALLADCRAKRKRLGAVCSGREDTAGGAIGEDPV